MIAALVAMPMQAAPVKQRILSQVPQNQDAAITEALYQDFLYTTQNMPLQVGDTFPKHTFKTPDGENFTITGKRTLLFVGGSICGGCSRITENYKQQISKQKINVVYAVVNVDSSGFPNITYGKTADVTLTVPSIFGVMTSGSIKNVLRHPFGIGTFLIDEANKVRFLRYGFEYEFKGLGDAIQSIDKKDRPLKKLSGFEKSLNEIKWQNNQLKAGLLAAKKYKTSLIINSESSCATCDGLLNSLKPFLTGLSKKNYGIFYISNTAMKLKIPGITFINDERKELMQFFNTVFYPSTFILKSDKYFGRIRYFAIGSDASSLSDKSYRDAVVKALDFAAK